MWMKDNSLSNCFKVVDNNGYSCLFLKCGILLDNDESILLAGIIKDDTIFCFYDLDLTNVSISSSEPDMFDKLLRELSNIHIKYGCKDVK